MALRTALFVEGSFGIPNRALVTPHRALWCETIAPLLGLPPPEEQALVQRLCEVLRRPQASHRRGSDRRGGGAREVALR